MKKITFGIMNLLILQLILPLKYRKDSSMKKSLLQPEDLTKGHPLPVLLLYSLPMFASMFFQQAYNLADSWIAGNFAGAVSLGAVGACYPVTVFFIAIASGLSIGTSIYCSQNFGSGQHLNVQRAITTSLICFIPFSLALMVLALILCPSILGWLSVPGEAMLPTRQYFTIYCFGLPFLFLYNITTGILNGLGNSRLPLYFLIASSILNVMLDLVLVLVIPLGIVGLALATLLAQAASSAATLWAAGRIYRQMEPKEPAESGASPSRLSVPVLIDILKLGIPSVIQHVFISTGQMALQSVINSYGIVVMTGYSIAFRINGLFVNSLMALSNALSGFIAQNQGRKNYKRIHYGYGICLLAGGCFTLCVTALLLLRGQAILGLFIDSHPNKSGIIQTGMGFMRVVAPFYILVNLKIITDGALRGIGRMNAFMMSSISDVLVRIFLGGPFSRRWGIAGVWWIWPLAWLVGTGICCISYFRSVRSWPRG